MFWICSRTRGDTTSVWMIGVSCVPEEKAVVGEECKRGQQVFLSNVSRVVGGWGVTGWC